MCEVILVSALLIGGGKTETISLLCLIEFYTEGVMLNTLLYDKIDTVEHIRLRIIKKVFNQRLNFFLLNMVGTR